MKLYERIRLLRETIFSYQIKMAEHFGVSQKTISHWEIGRNEPPYNVLNKFVSEFNISSNWLLTGNGEMFNNIEKSGTNLTSAQMLAINAIKNLADDGEVKDIVKYIEERQIIKEAKAKKHKNVG